jgi:CheY-like chemotaxis protein
LSIARSIPFFLGRPERKRSWPVASSTTLRDRRFGVASQLGPTGRAMRTDFQIGEDLAAVPCIAAERRIERVLVLEDSMLIALDAEDSLLACGVGEVVIAANVAAALAAIAEERPDFAVLDYNLGEESSEPVARALAEAQVPYCFATGYGDALERSRAVPPCGVLNKPYSQQDLAAVLSSAKADPSRG